MKKRRCLVTGGTGDVGRHLVRRLGQAGCDVAVYARPASDTRSMERMGASVFTGDLKDLQTLARAVEGRNLVFHLGEISLSDPCFLEGNIAAIKEIARAGARSHDFERLVFMSSMAVACFTEVVPAGEGAPVAKPMNDLHTRYKRRAEALLTGCGIPVSIVRPCHVYGPGANYLLNFFRLASIFGRAGLPFPGKKNALLSFIHVEDLCEAVFRSALIKKPKHRIYNAVDDLPFPREAFVEMVAKGIGRPIRLVSPPAFIQRPVFGFLDALSGSRLNSNFRSWGEYYFHDHVFSNRRMKEDLGLRLAYPTVEDGIGTFIEWLCSVEKKWKK